MALRRWPGAEEEHAQPQRIPCGLAARAPLRYNGSAQHLHLRGTTVSADSTWVRITDDEISVDEVLRAARRPGCGAVVLFLGTVRDSFRGKAVIGLEYEAHRALAERMLADVGAEALARGAQAVALVHRLGPMEVGDVSVAVAVASPHRPEAFTAGRYASDRLKALVPIWKREVFADGSVWVEGDDRVPSGSPTTLRPQPARTEASTHP